MPDSIQSTSAKSAIVCRVEGECDDLDLKLSRAWLRIAIAGVFAGQGMVFSLALNMTPPAYASLPYWILHGGLIFSSIVVMAFLGGPLFASTWGMLRGRRLSIEGLFTVSLLGAFVGSLVGSVTGQGSVYYEVVAIVIAIYTFGRMLGERSQSQMKLESARLRERFDRAFVWQEGGEWLSQAVSEVPVGARVRVDPGAAFTLDGVICSGVGYVQETALTGEPLPVVRRMGDRVRAGTWAVDSRFEMKVERAAGSRELDEILHAVEAADGRPSDLQTQANQLIRVFLPVVVGVSFSTAIFWCFMGTWVDAVLNSMAVLLVACPCALGLATPVAISQGLFRLAQMGLVSREGAFIDALARTRRIFFDKTGTLSESSLRVTELWVEPDLPVDRSNLLAAVLEAESSVVHPVARAVVQYLQANAGDAAGAASLRGKDVAGGASLRGGDAAGAASLRGGDAAGAASLRGKGTAGGALTDLHLLNGQGLEFRLSLGTALHVVQVGEASLVASDGALQAVAAQLHAQQGKRVYVLVDGRIVACFVLQERLRAGVDDVWRRLDAMRIEAEILTGDPFPELSVPENVQIESGLSSADKVRRVDASREALDAPLFVGDGINDAVAMTRASGSIAMHSGTGLARSVAMAQLTADRVEVIPHAIGMARDIHRRLRGNLIYAIAYNIVGMLLASAGLLHPVAAALIMLVSSFLVTARALSKYSGA
ncbi:HAD-IC family P-type ATPase [Coraliomargarita algicola]|uniref:HAD-IC family P-type ATPase n=1 Tax=Coraliomargarita algicola TaxID=3092156 RepID=A0ABZ0RI33_9BACT|nr:HAD-IC family P-type ATPase [Coraliomargarita sp. J2-16]WPJ95717.1 HAD-IC family P-type ATPase [Coraliomargarita sp. J2-16]